MPHWCRGLFRDGHLQVARRGVRHLFRHTACWEEYIYEFHAGNAVSVRCHPYDRRKPLGVSRKSQNEPILVTISNRQTGAADGQVSSDRVGLLVGVTAPNDVER